MTDETTDDRRTAIENEVLENPWKTQQQIADATGASRSWVADVLTDDDALSAIRSAYRSGFTIDANSDVTGRVAEAVDNSGYDDDVACRLMQSALDDDVARIEIRLEPRGDDDE